MFGEGFRAVAALQQERIALGHFAQGALQLSRLAGEDQRRKPGDLLFDCGKRMLVGKGRNLLDRLGPP